MVVRSNTFAYLVYDYLTPRYETHKTYGRRDGASCFHVFPGVTNSPFCTGKFMQKV
jgi:hypothetical protein